ncbi:MAG: helix-turn-helix transcriptional regulator, partial [Elusimicrobia bacterium]|nr:helix-turn-helix transcriptional regulator [Elusimicrobiota bacterium]
MKKAKSTICNKLSKILFEQNLSQEELAKKIGTKQQMISRWLTGGRNPSLNSLKKIAEALNVPLSYFVEFGEDKKNIEILKLKNKILQLEKENLNLKNKILEMEKKFLKL